MAAFLAYGEVRFPVQGSSYLQELVKHFESAVSFEDLQSQINLWLIFIGGPVILNRPSIRTINFQVHDSPPAPSTLYFAQVHYMLIGDADDAPNL